MKPKKLLSLVFAMALAIGLCSCGPAERSYEAADYILETPYSKDYRILQLTDIHLANKDDRAKQYDFLNLTITSADADMIVLSGDSFTFADKTVAKELFSFIDGFGVPWTISFGNHDEQCYFPIDWLTDTLNEYGSNCLFKDLQDDDVYGNANFAINLTQKDKVKAQVILFDSNRYNYGDYVGYDYIKDNQVEWYKSIVNYTTKQNGSTVPSVVFFHIPLPEFLTAWEEAEKGSSDAKLISGEKNEGVCCPDINTGLFDAMKSLGSTKAVCVGHDHRNNYIINYKGIYLAYGVNSTDRIYYSANMMGGRVIIVKDDGSLEFEDIFHTYEEVK